LHLRHSPSPLRPLTLSQGEGEGENEIERKGDGEKGRRALEAVANPSSGIVRKRAMGYQCDERQSQKTLKGLNINNPG